MTGGEVREWLDPALVTQVREDLLEHPGPVTDAAVAQAVRRTGRVLGSTAMLDLVGRLTAQLSGAGPLQPLLDRPGVTDVFVNGPHEVWADFGGGLEQVPLSLGAEADVRALAVRLSASGGRRLDDSAPLVDVRLPDGTRLNAVIPPLSGECTVMSFRIPRARGFTLDELREDGFVPGPLASLLEETLARRANFLVSGGTGSGKTALLGAMLSAADRSQRLLVVEDARELVITHPHVVQLAARQANVEGSGEVPMSTLVKNALRMRPDRLVVGEVRGAEVRDMLTALNTGHEGGCGTLHANTCAAVPARLEALGALAGMTPAAVHAQAATALDLLIHLRRGDAETGGAVRVAGAARPRASAGRERSAGGETGAGAMREARGIAEVAVPSVVEGTVRTEPVWSREGGFVAEGVARLQRTFAAKERS
ncbi:TadA family conjugal transfer-associated ATPase [Brevibacterium album]|uniref:TadA family conjugal transfer-associated ATPase n=1 Tax=Brevibacterium album TaxID=417948 RepID=UPI0003FD5D6F|nr:TadA family conjugal transfer-associated ATPase [Brevibacterium album]